MGLDSYAYKKKLTSDNWEVKKVGEKNKRTYEETEVMYLRKANQIHNWIIENKAGGEQDQREVELTIDDFKELKGVCEKVLKKSKLTPGLINNGWGSRVFDPSDKVIKLQLVLDGGKMIFRKAGEIELYQLEAGDFYTVKEDSDKETFDYAEQVRAIERQDNGTKRVDYGILTMGKLIVDPTTAQELLPTCAGFFFGSTEYTDWYLDDIKSCLEQIDEIIKDYEAEIASGTKDYDIEYYYYASW